MLLTGEERRRFSDYLKHQAESSRLIIEQLEKVPAGELLIPREKAKLAAYIIIAADLDSAETVTLT